MYPDTLIPGVRGQAKPCYLRTAATSCRRGLPLGPGGALVHPTISLGRRGDFSSPAPRNSMCCE